MALILPALYLGTMYVFYKYVQEKAREYEDETITVNINDVKEIDTENPLYRAVSEIANKTPVGPIIVCCTGDMQSMALLHIIMMIYDNIHINVLFINNERYHNMSEFVENICNDNSINFIQTSVETYDIMHCNVESNIETIRNTMINDLCKKLDTNVVFEAHTIENQSNYMLDMIFSNNLERTKLNTIKPFINMDMDMIKEFVDRNDIVYNVLDHNMTSAMNIFNEFDCVLKQHYPNWRENIINYTQDVNDKLRQFETNIDTIIDNCTKSDKYGFYYRYNMDMVSYDVFTNVINKLADNNNIERPSKYIKSQMWAGNLCYKENNNWFCDGHYIMYINDEFLNKIDNLRTYLDTINALDYNNDVTDIFYVDINEDQYRLCPNNADITDYIGDHIKGIVHLESKDERFNIIELFH
jgi:tRNA(Ile)-lysidine synthase TilS/MesJ